MKLTEATKNWLVANELVTETATEAEMKTALSAAIADGTLTVEKLAGLQDDEPEPAKGPTAAQVFGGSAPRVKNASECYSTKRTQATHYKTGLPVRGFNGAMAENPSELDNAKAGTWFKFALQRGGAPVELREHEKQLLHEMFERDKFVGQLGGEEVDAVPGQRVKAFLDDATSGGVEVVPEIVDAAIVTAPLLHSELAPLVDLRTLAAGRRVAGSSISNPSMSSTAEGTAITPITTDSMISDLSTTVYPAVAAAEVGLDFLSDSVADFGRTLSEVFGQAHANWLDNQIANGDGTTEPQGVFEASGTTAVSSENGAGGPITVADLESLLFSVAKQYRGPSSRCVFLSNDTTYSRIRGLAVSGTDQRRIFGLSPEDYMILGRPHKIQNDVTNPKIAFFAASKYRLYRRLGASLRFETGGRELALKNLGLLVLRSRYGGRLVDGSACAKITDAQS